MELSIKITKRKDNIWDNFLINSILVLLLFMISILSIVYVLIYDFIKEKIFRIKRTENEILEDILIENENFKLTKEYVIGGIEEYKMATNFLFSLVEYDDDMEVFKVINNYLPTELDNEYLTGLFAEFGNEILMQRIKYGENGKLTSDLIGFDSKTGKIKSYKKIGIFNLYKFDKKKNIIQGSNKTENIFIEINKAIA
jgi:hypothetical protein